LEIEELEMVLLDAELLELVHADQVASEVEVVAAGVLEVVEEVEVVAAGVLEVVLEELHPSHPSAETTPATATMVATENFMLIDFEVLIR